jgi:hypothetical protein
MTSPTMSSAASVLTSIQNHVNEVMAEGRTRHGDNFSLAFQLGNQMLNANRIRQCGDLIVFSGALESGVEYECAQHFAALSYFVFVIPTANAESSADDGLMFH